MLKKKGGGVGKQSTSLLLKSSTKPEYSDLNCSRSPGFLTPEIRCRKLGVKRLPKEENDGHILLTFTEEKAKV